MPNDSLTPDSMSAASADLFALAGTAQTLVAEVSRRTFILAAPKAPRGAVVRLQRPMPKMAAEMDARSKPSKGYRPISDRIKHMEEMGWLSGKDGWTDASDRKSNIMKMASRRRLKGKVEEETDILNSYWGWRGIMEPEYDLLESYTILDVEAIYKRAIDRMHSLAFRNGVHVVGEEPAYVDYLKDRIAQIGYVMGKGFPQFLKEIIKNLWVCSNCIVSKIRDEENSGGIKSERNGKLVPVAGYAIVPPHTIYPFLDGRGHIEKWRRFYKDGRPYRDYAPEDIIHFRWDVKPGHIYGTPRILSVRDDIFALRRLEENVELLLVQHLFPLFHVKVGNEKAPVEYLPDGSSEIDYIRAQIMNMPKEGVFVTDDRVEVDVVGAQGKGADPGPMLEHYLNRTLIGLGVSGVDMGLADTSNRATSDTVSQNLKEMVKADLQSFADQVDMEFFRELFQESRVKISVQKAVATTHLDFGEIDVDGQIKQETHALNLFQSHGLDQDELRQRIRHNPFTKDQEKKTHFEKHMVGLERAKHKMQLELVEKQQEHDAKMQTQAEKHQAKMGERSEETKLKSAAVAAASTKKTKVTKKSATGSSHTKEVHEPTSHAKKALSNLVQPANQHGKNFDPHKARSSEDPDLVQAVYDALMAGKDADGADWGDVVTSTVSSIEGLETADALVLARALSASDDADHVWATLRAHLDPDSDADESNRQ
jgi:hypothetical protein